MTWNYRIVEKTCKHTGEVTQGIHEVYYDGNNEPSSVTETPVDIQWFRGESTHLILNQIQRAFEKPILCYEDFEDSIPF